MALRDERTYLEVSDAGSTVLRLRHLADQIEADGLGWWEAQHRVVIVEELSPTSRQGIYSKRITDTGERILTLRYYEADKDADTD